MLFLILILLIFLLYILRISKAISKYIAVFMDFLLLGGFTAYLLHDKVSVKIASGNAVYFWDLVFAVGVCILYYVLLNVLISFFPKIAACINYVAAWAGTFFLYLLIFLIFNDGLPQLVNDDSLSMLINLIIVSILAIVSFRIRKNIFDTKETTVVVKVIGTGKERT